MLSCSTRIIMTSRRRKIRRTYSLILNARRELLTPPPVKPRQGKEVVEPWTLATLWGGLKRVRIWLGLAIRVLFFNRDAFREIARDAYMTGPAILIAIVGALVTSYFAVQPFRWQAPTVNLLALFVTILGVQIAGRALGGKGTYTSTLRVIGFAGMLDLVGLLAFIPPLATIARSLAFILHLLAVWIGASVAHELHGWRSLILPVMLIIVYVLSLSHWEYCLPVGPTGYHKSWLYSAYRLIENLILRIDGRWLQYDPKYLY